jgi:hypothetical protein
MVDIVMFGYDGCLVPIVEIDISRRTERWYPVSIVDDIKLHHRLGTYWAACSSPASWSGESGTKSILTKQAHISGGYRYRGDANVVVAGYVVSYPREMKDVDVSAVGEPDLTRWPEAVSLRHRETCLQYLP